MKIILSSGRPFEVLDPVVAFYAVLMINFGSMWIDWNECERHQSMQGLRGTFSIVPRANLAVPVIIQEGLNR
jgi:hypothetical protein